VALGRRRHVHEGGPQSADIPPSAPAQPDTAAEHAGDSGLRAAALGAAGGLAGGMLHGSLLSDDDSSDDEDTEDDDERGGVASGRMPDPSASPEVSGASR
jgi:hypothetical protein